MTLTRRQAIDACREGPALFADLPGNEIDIERLSEFVIGRGLDAAIHVIDGTLEGILWIKGGAPGEAWFLEADGGETIVPIEPEGELLRDIAASGSVSCYVCAPGVTRVAPKPTTDHRDGRDRTAPSAGPVVSRAQTTETASRARPAPTVGAAHGGPRVDRVGGRAPEPDAAPLLPEVDAGAAPAEALRAVPPPVEDSPVAAPIVQDAGASDVVPTPSVLEVPSARPWPAILAEVRMRVAKQRGKRLADRFADALGAALEAHGGRIDGDRIVAPPLSDQHWAAIIAAGCAPVSEVAGRAWTERALDTAERTVLDREGTA